MPSADDLLREVGQANYISSLDCTQGYYQIQMNPEDIQKTAFVTLTAHYEWIVMPLGAKWAGNSFQRMMDEILLGKEQYARAYIDNTAVFFNECNLHFGHLESVLESIGNTGFTLKLSKCWFCKKQIKFVGHIIGSGKKMICESNIQAIVNMPDPTTEQLLKSFLEMASYYKKWMPKFADVAWPLTEMTWEKQYRALEFIENQRTAFNKLKSLLISSAVLVTPVYDRPFIIQTDAPDYAVGACLAQMNNNGIERPIAYSSSKLTNVQCRWSVIEKESYSVVFALSTFDSIVF